MKIMKNNKPSPPPHQVALQLWFLHTSIKNLVWNAIKTQQINHFNNYIDGLKWEPTKGDR